MESTCRNATTKQAYFLERSLRINFRNTHVMYNSVLAEGRRSHEMIDGFPFNGKPALPVIHHNTDTSCCANFTAQICLPRLTELALSALRLVARYNMVSRLNLGYAFTNAFNNPANRKRLNNHPTRCLSYHCARMM